MIRTLAGCVAGLMISAVAFASETELPTSHPDTTDFKPVFADDLSNAIFPEGIWTVEEGGVITASEDQAIWTKGEYENYVLDLEFKTGEAANSGVIIYCSDMDNWIPNSVEIQIADDHAEQWANAAKTWQCAAIFGHKAATESVVKKPGEWNHMTVWAKGQEIIVMLNGKLVNHMDMSKWTSAETNPDGSEIPGWLSTPKAELATKGNIGFQGKHGGAPIWFRNITMKQL